MKGTSYTGDARDENQKGNMEHPETEREKVFTTSLEKKKRNEIDYCY